MKIALILLTGILLSFTPLHARVPKDGVVYVSGKVTDGSSSETLAGVQVRVKGTSIVTYTDFDGNYFLPELPAGTYTLEFQLITYENQIVFTSEGGSEELNVSLDQR